MSESTVKIFQAIGLFGNSPRHFSCGSLNNYSPISTNLSCSISLLGCDHVFDGFVALCTWFWPTCSRLLASQVSCVVKMSLLLLNNLLCFIFGIM